MIVIRAKVRRHAMQQLRSDTIYYYMCICMHACKHVQHFAGILVYVLRALHLNKFILYIQHS